MKQNTTKRMKKVLGIVVIATICSVFFHNCKKSDQGFITGLVTDSITHKALNGVSVSIIASQLAKTGSNNEILGSPGSENTNLQAIQTAKTGKDGRYTLEDTKLGNLLLQFSLDGYNTTIKKEFIVAGRDFTVNTILGPAKPDVETGKVSSVTNNSAVVTGSIKDIGIDDVTQYGHCWSYTTSTPTITSCNGKSAKGAISAATDFSSQLTNLLDNKRYYVRAYATNKAGTSYGKTVAFKTIENDITEGLVTFFDFNGELFDQSGNGYNIHGSWSTFPPPLPFTTDRFGASDGALLCSGYYYYIYNPDFVTANQFSVSMWFYTTGWDGSYRTLFSMGYNAYVNEIRIAQNAYPNNFYFDVRTNTSTYKITLNSYPSTYAWHHLVALRNSSQIQLYLDGVLKGSTYCDSQQLNLDYWNWGYGYMFFGFDVWNFFNGAIDDVRFYNRALNTSEIQYLSTH
jgi:hypothetical protein